jgi:hypothetical protein
MGPEWSAGVQWGGQEVEPNSGTSGETMRSFCVGRALVSLVSVWARNWFDLCGRIERVETGEIIEIGNIHAVVVHVAENMAGCGKGLGEYPTNPAQTKTLLRALVAERSVLLSGPLLERVLRRLASAVLRSNSPYRDFERWKGDFTSA